MALRAAVANGNWSSPSTWNRGILPAAGDVVASNGFNVTIDQDVNVDSITNAATSPVTAVPIMTGYTTPSGIASSSSIYSAGYEPWRAFDGTTSSSWITASGQSTGWLAYEFSIAKIITSYTLAGTPAPTAFPKDWTFEGWNGSSWIVLHTVTGNTNTSTYTGTFANTTAYIKYRINITLNNGFTNYVSISELYLYENNTYTSTTTAGGTFILNSGVTVTCTNTGDGIYNAVGFVCLDYTAASGTSTINANIRGRDGTTVFCVRKSGAGTLNINGTLKGLFSSNSNGGALQITGTGTVTITGNIQDPSNGGQTVQVDATTTLNIVGSITGGYYNGQQTVKINTANCIINITGNILAGGGGATGWTTAALQTNAANTIINISGNIDATNGNSASKYGIVIAGANNTINHTGNIIGSSDNVLGGLAFLTTQVVYYNQIGYVRASMSSPGFSSTNTTSVNILSGPFICSPSGVFPLSVFRMHYKITALSYFEFRDSSTNGALPPAASAPATRLVSPDTVVDAPIPANVRNGVTYALGSQTGTLKVPLPSQVSKGIQTDNTVGTAALTPEDVWNALTSSMTTPGSIGNRLKNTSTVETTGDQIASLL